MKDARCSLAGRRLLVVEDEYFIAEDLREDFESAGAQVIGPASNVEAALALIDAEEIDGAVLDINLRQVMVYAVADALAARGIPFVFATGYEVTRIPARFEDIRYFQKPVDPSLVAEALCGDLELTVP